MTSQELCRDNMPTTCKCGKANISCKDNYPIIMKTIWQKVAQKSELKIYEDNIQGNKVAEATT